MILWKYKVFELICRRWREFEKRAAWVSEYQATPEMDANANAVAITSIKIEHEGFIRDTSLTEPVET